ncbi:hypothetical protein Droror1_Dr00010349 [Drosera rotundifolia]
MQGYGRIDEDLDEYEEDGGEFYEDAEGNEYEEAEEEEEEEVEEDPEKQRVISEYLELRQKLKEEKKEKLVKESRSAQKTSLTSSKTIPLRNFGSFFGPSQPVIADRVIQVSKSFLETQHRAQQASTLHGDRNKTAMPLSSRPKNMSNGTTNHSRNGTGNHLRNPIKSKVQTLKDTRDYSFLSNDAEDPRHGKNTTQRNASDTRSAQVAAKIKPMANHSARPALNGHGERTPGHGNDRIQGSQSHPVQKSSYGSKPNSIIHNSNRNAHHEGKLEPRKEKPYANGSRHAHHEGKLEPRKEKPYANGSRPSHPVMSKDMPAKKSIPAMEKLPPISMEKKSLSSFPKKVPASSLDKKASVVGMKAAVPGGQRPPSAKLQTSGARLPLQQRRETQGAVQQKALPTKSVPSLKPQVNLATKIPSRTSLSEDRPKKKPIHRKQLPYDDEEDEGAKALAMIRKMFRYNPAKYAGDDEDISDMEADFRTIEREEKKSARIAREEDERELRLIEEEERQKRMRKKRKLSGS